MRVKHLLLIIVLFSFSLSAKVYDCFLFLNELEILDIRLHEMNAHVDQFVIVESCETFRGESKPFVFAANQDRFKDFLHKITYIQLTDRLVTPNPWDREFFQRNQILRGLKNCNARDIVILSDVDEIIRGKEIPQLCKAIELHKLVGVTHEYHSNFLNDVCGSFWRGSVAGRYGMIATLSPQRVREQREQVPSVATGWHYTWQGDLDSTLYKLSAFSHFEADTPEYRAYLMENFLFRYQNPAIVVDETFPDYVRENQEYFLSIGYLRPPTEE